MKINDVFATVDLEQPSINSKTRQVEYLEPIEGFKVLYAKDGTVPESIDKSSALEQLLSVNRENQELDEAKGKPFVQAIIDTKESYRLCSDEETSSGKHRLAVYFNSNGFESKTHNIEL